MESGGIAQGSGYGGGGGINQRDMSINTIRLVLVVTLHVLGQMIAAHEFLLADAALELLFAGMGALVPRELIGAGEALVAVVPLADKGALPGVDSLVGLKVTALEVVLAALGEAALVDATPGGGGLSCCDPGLMLLLLGYDGCVTLLGGNCAEQEKLAGWRGYWSQVDDRLGFLGLLFLLGLFRWCRWCWELGNRCYFFGLLY